MLRPNRKLHATEVVPAIPRVFGYPQHAEVVVAAMQLHEVEQPGAEGADLLPDREAAALRLPHANGDVYEVDPLGHDGEEPDQVRKVRRPQAEQPGEGRNDSHPDNRRRAELPQCAVRVPKPQRLRPDLREQPSA